MTVSKPCYFGNLLLGIVGVDVNLAYILATCVYKIYNFQKKGKF